MRKIKWKKPLTEEEKALLQDDIEKKWNDYLAKRELLNDTYKITCATGTINDYIIATAAMLVFSVMFGVLFYFAMQEVRW